jgi:asparagine synthase (glutamine-hydrolysing)
MTGFCGHLGDGSGDIGELVSDLYWTGQEREQVYTSSGMAVADVHRPDDGERPVETGDGHLIWVWGTVFGYESDERPYESRPPGEPTTGYVARLYERDGLDVVAGLNGQFFGVAYDRSAGVVRFFTDRLGTVDACYATPSSGELIFSSHLQSLQRWPGTDWSFDVDYLTEFFTYTRSMGVKTPLEGVSRFPPASVVTVDLAEMQPTVDQYWRPRHQPVDAPFSQFVDEFVDRFRASMADRTAESGEYGLLLSGGADSRLIVAALEDTESVTAYHMADWMSREARTAERVALTAGVDFELLHRDDEHLARQLSRTPALSNFQGKFNQAQAEGFLPEIRRDVDYLVDGLYADILFKGWGIPQLSLPLGPFGSLTLPVAGSVASVEDYLDRWETEVPGYVRTEQSSRELLEANISSEGDGLTHHGVPTESPVELMVWSHVFPQTNMGGGFQIRSIRQHLPYRNPMLDNRLLDLSLSMPLEYVVRRNLIGAAIERLAPDLAAIPHPETGVPLDYPFPIDQLSWYATELWRLAGRSEAPPRRDLGHDPWEPHAEVIRVREFVEEALARHEPTIRSLPFLDWDGVRTCYDAHLAGEDHTTALYMLVTFLEMPLTKRLARQQERRQDTLTTE